MSKKRTREQKSKAKHSFVVSWTNNTYQAPSRMVVNRQTESAGTKAKSKKEPKESAHLLDKDSDLTSIKKSIVKSLILTSLILATEVVLYFLWS